MIIFSLYDDGAENEPNHINTMTFYWNHIIPILGNITRFKRTDKSRKGLTQPSHTHTHHLPPPAHTHTHTANFFILLLYHIVCKIPVKYTINSSDLKTAGFIVDAICSSTRDFPETPWAWVGWACGGVTSTATTTRGVDAGWRLWLRSGLLIITLPGFSAQSFQSHLCYMG